MKKRERKTGIVLGFSLLRNEYNSCHANCSQRSRSSCWKKRSLEETGDKVTSRNNSVLLSVLLVRAPLIRVGRALRFESDIAKLLKAQHVHVAFSKRTQYSAQCLIEHVFLFEEMIARNLVIAKRAAQFHFGDPRKATKQFWVEKLFYQGRFSLSAVLWSESRWPWSHLRAFNH